MAVTVREDSIVVEGTRRRFLVDEPAQSASGLVLSLHGSRSAPESQTRLSRMEPLVALGMVVAYPQGGIASGAGHEWDHHRDVTFISELVAKLADQHAIPGSKAAMTGMSGGARMSCRFASLCPEQVAMVGAVAGLRGPSRSEVRPPIPVVAFHGTADRINPFAGSGTPRWDESVRDAAERWALANGLPGQCNEVQVSPRLSRIAYGQSPAEGQVTLWVAKGAGHTWPGSRLPLTLRLMLGRTNMEIDATKEIRDLIAAVRS